MHYTVYTLVDHIQIVYLLYYNTYTIILYLYYNNTIILFIIYYHSYLPKNEI